jgi:hypothetical protein
MTEDWGGTAGRARWAGGHGGVGEERGEAVHISGEPILKKLYSTDNELLVGEGTWDPHISEWRGERGSRVILDHTKIQSSPVGPRESKTDQIESKTYKMVHLKRTSNCNGIFPNRQIVMAYLRNAKDVMAYI